MPDKAVVYPPSVDDNGAYYRLDEDILGARLRWILEFQRSNNGLLPIQSDLSVGWGIAKSAIRRTLDIMEERGWIQMIDARVTLNEGKLGVIRKLDVDLPKISIVITTYRRPKSLHRLMGVIAEQHHTNFGDIEIAIINDGSTYPDFDPRSYSPLNIVYVERPRAQGDQPSLYSLKNQAVAMTANPLILMLDDDLVFDESTLFIIRLYHALLGGYRPVLIPHYSNRSEPQHFQNPFDFISQPPDWDKLRVWASFAGMSLSRDDWKAVGGVCGDFDGSMGFADLDFGIRLWRDGCQVCLVDGITMHIEDSETGSLRSALLRQLHPDNIHPNGRLFIERNPDFEKYGITND